MRTRECLLGRIRSYGLLQKLYFIPNLEKRPLTKEKNEPPGRVENKNFEKIKSPLNFLNPKKRSNHRVGSKMSKANFFCQIFRKTTLACINNTKN